ncbi:MAG TPA: universal stress protein [Anaerolineales bacterium]|jgi:nucleotide-binding universal stress UspA family protein
MLDTILVPLDGSQLAECVIAHSIAFARPFDAEVILLRMLEKNHSATAPLFDLLNWQINKTKATLYLEKTKAHLQASGLRARAVVLEGLVAEGITEYSQNQGTKLIVLSSHGSSGLSQWGISSITQKIVLCAPTSLLIVRANQPHLDESPDSPVYQRILVPLDGSQRAENVLPIIAQLAHFHKSQVHLVNVVQTPEMARQMPPSDEDTQLSNRVKERNQEEAGNYLEQLKSRSHFEDIVIQTHLLTSDHAAVALHQLIDQEQIDLLVLSAHGYSGNHQWPYGSLVNNFILYGKVPLLIVQDLPAKQESMHVELPSRDRIEH